MADNHLYNNNRFTNDQQNFSIPRYNSNRQFNPNERNQTEKNLRNKLDNAFTDLESLRKALKDIRVRNDNTPKGRNNTLNNDENIINRNNPYNNAYFSPGRSVRPLNPDDDFYGSNGGSRSNSKNKPINKKKEFNLNDENHRPNNRMYFSPISNNRSNFIYKRFIKNNLNQL